MNDELTESINHPAHYGGDTVYEAIKVIEAWNLCFHTGNAVKYIARAGRKDASKEAEDLRKAVWYLERKIATLEPPQYEVSNFQLPSGDFRASGKLPKEKTP